MLGGGALDTEVGGGHFLLTLKHAKSLLI
jgi:hypothetical protein